MRDGEAEGVDYFFVTRQNFEDWIAKGELLEYALVYGDYKGIPRAQVGMQHTHRDPNKPLKPASEPLAQLPLHVDFWLTTGMLSPPARLPQVDSALAQGTDVILRIDVQGAATMRKLMPHAVSIFMVSSSRMNMYHHVIGRFIQYSTGEHSCSDVLPGSGERGSAGATACCAEDRAAGQCSFNCPRLLVQSCLHNASWLSWHGLMHCAGQDAAAHPDCT